MVRVRFAPSPTGHLHIGGVRTAIFNWLFARHNGGKFLVRIEDTDVLRSKKEYVDSILESLKWVGLIPDEPLIYQMSRVEEHRKAAKILLESGFAYPCFCEPKEADERIAQLEKGISDKYDGTCRNKKYTKEDLLKPHAIRFKLPDDEKAISFVDLIREKVSFDIDQLDDFVILRRDATPTYNFCVVVDDIFMEITHVVRGEEHLVNTPKQILLYNALGGKIPQFAHLPLILSPSGAKLSKRDAAVSVVEYKNQGFLPDALFNYLLRLGWAHGDQEIFSKEEMIKYFDLDKVGKKGAIFDMQKLLWLNGTYIRKLNAEEFIENVAILNNDKLKMLTNVWGRVRLERLFELYRERATTIVELVDDIVSFSQAPETLDKSLIEKWLSSSTVLLLQQFVDRITHVEVMSHENLLSLAKNICDENKVKLVTLAQPLRLALTGKTFSPGVFELIELLPIDEFKKRVAHLIKVLAV